jgi:mRNA interferase MazF
MTTYRQGQVVLVPFPFADLSSAKQRPAVIVSASWYNNSRPDCVLAAITSSVPAEMEPDMVRIQGSEVKTAGLRMTSVVRAGKVFTIEQDRIVKPMGQLSRASLSRVLDGIRLVISDTQPGKAK